METFIDTNSGRFPVLFSEFPDRDIHCEVPDLQKLPREVLVYHSLYPNQDTQIMKLVLLLDLLRDKKIEVFVPYLPYARQDKRVVEGEAISSESICRLLVRFGVITLHTLDCHFMKERDHDSHAGLPIHNIHAASMLRAKLPGRAILIAPDEGAKHLAHNNYMTKLRGSYVSAPVKYREIISVRTNNAVLGDFMIIVDDIIGTGSTIALGAQLLKENGVKKVYAMATHGFFFDGTSELERYIDKIVTTDSIDNPYAEVKCEEIYNLRVRDEFLGSFATTRPSTTG